MRVAATLPELSEWTLHILVACSFGGGGEGDLHISRYGDVPLFEYFLGCSRIFGYLSGLFQEFSGIIFGG